MFMRQSGRNAHSSAREAMDDSLADRFFAKFIGYLRLELRLKAGRAGELLSVRSFAGARLVPEFPREARELGRTGNTPSMAYATEGFYTFWIEAFGSLVMDQFAPVCGRCGVELALTKTGRPPRRKYCDKCHFPAWREEQKPEEMRKKERNKKRAQRARER
jgi:hypothetical protein